jgi:hypothetical protein
MSRQAVSCRIMRQIHAALGGEGLWATKRYPVKPCKGKSMEVMILLGRRIHSLYGLVGGLMEKCGNRPDAVRCR